MAKLLQAQKICCTERHLFKNHLLNFFQTVGAFLVWIGICVANSASGSTVPLLPVPEVNLGFARRLFQVGPGDAGKILSRSYQQQQAPHVFNNLEIRGGTTLRYLLSLPILPAHSTKVN